jgi:hypothetical protein
MADKLMEIADRGELAPDVELRTYWSAFCDCDPSPDDFQDRMEAAGLIVLDAVNDDDLDNPFAREIGIEPGGSVWRLTDRGSQAYATPSDKEGGE